MSKAAVQNSIVDDDASGEMPEGWARPRAERVCSVVQSGGTPKGKEFTTTGDVPFLKAYNLVDQRVDLAWKPQFIPRPVHEQELARSLVRPNDVLMNIVGPPLGKVAIVPTTYPEWNINQALVAFRPNPVLDHRFLYYVLCEGTEIRRLANEYRGSAGQINISLSQARGLPIRLPPLAEQHRIVAKVEELLAEVNAARARLAKAPALLKRFRQSVLAAACSGRLTEEWRATRPDVEDWTPDTVRGLCERVTSGSRAWSRYYRDDAEATFVMAQNVRPLRFDQSTRQGVAPPGNDPEAERTRIARDDILITIVGANTGDVCRVPAPVQDHFVCQSVAMLRLRDSSRARFVELWLNSTEHGRGRFLDLMYGEGRPHLGLDQIRDTDVMLPSAVEQHEIVRRVDALFKLADTIEQHVAVATARADKLTQAILAKAFRGELVPTEAELARKEGRAFETAAEMLARVRAQGPVEKVAAVRRRASGRRAARMGG